MSAGTYNKKHPYPRTFPEPNSEVCILRVATCHCYDTEFAAGGIVRLLHFEFVSRQSVPLEELGHSILKSICFKSIRLKSICSKGGGIAFSTFTLFSASL